MTCPRTVAYVVVSIASGVLFAAIAEFAFFVGSTAWLNLFVWAGAGIAIGAAAGAWSRAIWFNAILGFALVLSYSIMGYRAAAPLLGAIVPFIVIALFGALGMATAGIVGQAIRRLRRRRRQIAVDH